jgi:hypothetical protein
MTHPLPGHVQQLTTQAVLMHFPMWLNVFSFSDRIILFIRLSLIHGEIPATRAQYTHSSRFPLTPLPLPMVEPQMRDPSLMHTRIGLCSSMICMTIATAKLPGLITTSLILPHPILKAIACHLHIMMDGCPLCFHYDTVLMLPHVIVSLYFHPSIPMMGRKSHKQLMVLNTFLMNHTTSKMK